MIGIYKITSPSDKVYIGQSWNIKERFKYYRKVTCKGQTKLYNSFLKYTYQNHIFEIVHELPIDVSQEIVDRYEILYMDLYRSCGLELLNLKEGGRGGTHSEETRAKLRKALKGRQARGIGFKHSEETKKKMRKPKVNKLNYKSRVGNPSGFKGKRHTIEARQQMSITRKGRKSSEETKNKLRGPRTEERKRNQSIAIKKWWDERKNKI